MDYGTADEASGKATMWKMTLQKLRDTGAITISQGRKNICLYDSSFLSRISLKDVQNLFKL